MNWFLHTDLGLTIRATGNNEVMIRALGVNTDAAKVATLVISNALVGLSGSLVAQNQGFADVGMGSGSLVAAVEHGGEPGLGAPARQGQRAEPVGYPHPAADLQRRCGPLAWG